MTDIRLQFLANEAEEDEGLGHAGIETFKDAPYASIARECGQNSSDARLAEPVLLSFDLLTIPTKDVPDIESFRATVSACAAKSDDGGEEKNIDFFHQANDLVSGDEIKVLHIADHNTKGLRGPCTPGNPFHSLVKATGVSNKEQDTSGGSFGIGKNAVFAVSELQTVFYSTRYQCLETGNLEFLTQGKSILISHTDAAGVPRKATGYWGAEKFKPVSMESECPAWLYRESRGTSIFSLGFRELDQWQYLIAASLLQNFFVAIHRGEMEFKVNDSEIHIDSDSIALWFQDERVINAADENGHRDDFEYAAALYDCLVSEEASVTDLEITGLGTVRVRVLVRDELPKRISIIRNGMLITDSLENFGDKFKSFPMYRDFVAIVEPVEDEGSALIKRLENPRHDGLSAERISDETKRRTATKTMRSLAREVRHLIKEQTQIALEEVQALNELAEFFADVDQGDRLPEGDADTDPDKFIYKPKVRKRKQVKVPTPDAGNDGGAGGEDENEGGMGGGRGDGEGSGAGGKGTMGKKVSVQLDDERNFLPDPVNSAKRTLFFTPIASEHATLVINAPGINSMEELSVSTTSEGSLAGGRVTMGLVEGSRTQIEVEFSEPYDGPIDVIALRIEAQEAANEA